MFFRKAVLGDAVFLGQRLLVRMPVGLLGVLVTMFAMLVCRRRMLLGLFMLADRVMVLRLMMVMRGRVMVSSCVVMVAHALDVSAPVPFWNALCMRLG